MAKTRANEREFQGQVISWIKKRIEQGGIPFEHATNDSSLYGLDTTRFPDVLLTLDFECREPFCGWELKTPKTSARDAVLLKKAVKKAQTLDAKYFVTWNMQTAIIWSTPPKTRIRVNEDDKVQEIGPDHRISQVSDIRERTKAGLLEDTCRRLVMDLARLYEDERINLPVADTTVFVSMVGAASVKMAGSLLRDINKARANKGFNRRLNAWAKKQGVSKYDQDYYETLAQQMAYKIIGKVLFYLTLRKQNVQLPKLDLQTQNYKAAMVRMRGLFQLALEVDYQAIFEGDITDEITLSEDSARVIIDLTDNLAHWTFELMGLDVIGNVFEKLVPEDARHSLGQYFTPDNLVDLIVGFCVKSADDVVMDPTCGTGTFLIRTYNRLRALGAKRRSHHDLLEQVWGIDIAGFPAELATINLCRQDLTDYLNFPRVLARDFFEVMPGDKFGFPPPKKTAKTGDRMHVQIPKFDALVGNFPFIRQELIEKAEKGYKKKLEAALFDSWAKEYPALFKNGGKKGHELRLSGQADIYAYMFFHAAAHLKPGGRMGFITSNSWLDVAYGYQLQKFFLSKFKLVGVFESRCEPWFEQSAVNTVFTVVERCDNEKERAANYVRFVKVKKPLAQLFPQDPLTDAQARWIALERFVDKVEEIGIRWDACGGEKFKKSEAINEEYVKQPEMVSYEDDEIRVRMIRQVELWRQVVDAGETVKWGQYLRGPDVYFEMLSKAAAKLVALGRGSHRAGEVYRGFTTGVNKFFYLTQEDVKHWRLEKDFVRPVIRSPKECARIQVKEKDLGHYVFICRRDREELRGTRALKYIKWGEKQKTNRGDYWCDVSTVSGRRLWYALPRLKPGQILLPKITGRSLRCIMNSCKAEVDCNFYEVNCETKSLVEGLSAYLNSAMGFVQRELIGRANLGDGALKTEGIDWERLLVPKNEALTKLRRDVGSLFEKISKRPIKHIHAEARQKDRIDFEERVLESLGLPKELANRVMTATVELVEERHLLPKLRRATRKKRVEQDLEKLREDVIEEVLANGVERFPDAFIKASARTDWEEVGIAAEEIKFGATGMGVQEICDGEGMHLMEVWGLEKARYIVYAKQKGEQIVRVPRSEIVMKKAVHDYESYVRAVRDRLYMSLMEKSGDHNLSENLARQVCQEFGLPGDAV